MEGNEELKERRQREGIGEGMNNRNGRRVEEKGETGRRRDGKWTWS